MRRPSAEDGGWTGGAGAAGGSVGLDWVMQRPPAPVPSSAPATAFSASVRTPSCSAIAGLHYDTTFGTPGAADDKTAVAAMLETAHALTSGKPLRNDVVTVLTDGEEPGLLGAASSAAGHPLADQGGVVLNW